MKFCDLVITGSDKYVIVMSILSSVSWLFLIIWNKESQEWKFDSFDLQKQKKMVGPSQFFWIISTPFESLWEILYWDPDSIFIIVSMHQ
jgi:hypothetical protein